MILINHAHFDHGELAAFRDNEDTVTVHADSVLSSTAIVSRQSPAPISSQSEQVPRSLQMVKRFEVRPDNMGCQQLTTDNVAEAGDLQCCASKECLKSSYVR